MTSPLSLTGCSLPRRGECVKKKSSRTAAVRAGVETDRQHGAVIPPIHLSSTFSFEGFDRPREYDYTRSGNPSRDLLGSAIAEAEAGHGAVVTSTGMSAIHLVLQLLKPGDLVVASHDCYGGTHRLLSAYRKRGTLAVDFADLTDASDRERALAQAPQLVWIETPSNPLLRITDLAAVGARARAHRGDVIVAADNTFLSPALQKPLSLGCDLVVHSTTKYLNGHSDVVGGAVVAASPELAEELAWWANCLGLTGAPFDSYLTLRGLRTLHARMRCHEENAAAVVELLSGHPAVARVFYPGLAEHPGHSIAKAQQDGYGGMVSFELKGGEPAVRRLVDGLALLSLAESLGGVESLVAHPATMTHAAMDPVARREAGITEGLVRLSVGIEDPADLCTDLEAGLDRCRSHQPSLSTSL